jgi:hypothetical protein
VIRSPVFLAQPDAGFVPSRSQTRWNSQPGSRCSPPDPGFRFSVRETSSFAPLGLGLFFAGHPRLTLWAAFFRGPVPIALLDTANQPRIPPSTK